MFIKLSSMPSDLIYQRLNEISANKDKTLFHSLFKCYLLLIVQSRNSRKSSLTFTKEMI